MFKRISILALAITCLYIGVVFAQSQEPSDQNEAPLTATTSVKTEQEVLVTDIEVVGNTAVSTTKITSVLKTKVGSVYHENIVSEDMKRLYALGFFSDIKMDTQDYQKGVKLIIVVTERPIIQRIGFLGVKKLRTKDDKLKEQLKSKEQQYLDYLSLTDDMETIRKMYEKKGFSQVQIDYKVDIANDSNKATVLFKIVEGKRKRIKRIYVEGNLHFSDARILKIIKTKSAWLFNPGVLKEDVWLEDIERVKSFYQRNGYSDVAVDVEKKTDPAGRFWYITLKVSEGKLYLVGSLKIEGNKDIFEPDIRSKVKKSVPGNVFSQDLLKEDILDIQGLYFDKGYIAARVNEATAVNNETGRVDILLNMEENGIFYVDKIKVRGNIKTRDVVIRRQLRIKPGDRFDGDKLRRSKERLQNLGFFEEVSYDTEDTLESNTKDLIVDVKEAKTGAFSFGGGYSSVDKLVGFVEVEQKNFDWKNWPYFTGAGQDLKVRASFGSLTQDYNLSFTNPWVFDYPVSFGFDLYKRSHKRDSDVGYGYDEDVTGGDIRLGKEISEYLSVDTNYRHDQIKISDISSGASADLLAEEGKNTISSMEFGITYDSRDNVFDPTRGNVLTNSVQVAGGPFGGDKDFWKWYSHASHYFKVFNRSVIEFKARAGLADTYDDTVKVPIYERFFAGGANTIRGYRERKVGPIDIVTSDPLGGAAMLIGNIEYTYALFNFLKLATFYDIGNVWAKASDFGSNGYKAGIGVGIRLKTPIGPIMLDYGIPLNKEPGENKKGRARWHFSMSHGF